MALTEETLIDKLEVINEWKQIQVRTANIIKRDGVEISRTFARHVVTPATTSSELANESAEVQAIANLFHTQELKDAYASHLLTT